MNENRKSYQEYFCPSVSERKQGAEELAAIISSFVHNTAMKPADIIALNMLLKQLNRHNNNLPRKVLRGIENKFEKIRQSYQR